MSRCSMHSHVHNSCAMAKKMDEVWIQAFGAGAAVPNRFNTLEQLLESAVKSVRLESEPKLQMAGILAFCEELQRILKIAFVENGFLAKEIEEVTQAYQSRMTVYERKIEDLEQQNRTVTAQVVKLRRRVWKAAQARKVPTEGKIDASTNTLPCGGAEGQWTVNKKCSDYDTLNALSDCQAPDFDQMVRFNTLLMEFIHDEDREQLSLPMMGGEERSELARLSSVYKVRCRFGKENITSAQLVKGRQSCLPAPGELDSIMSKYVTTEGERSCRSAQLPRKPDPQSTRDPPTEDTRIAQVAKVESDDDMLLCSETVLQPLTSNAQSPSLDLPRTAAPLSYHTQSTSSRIHLQSSARETGTPPQGVKEDKSTPEECSALSRQLPQRVVPADKAAEVDPPLSGDRAASSPSSGREGGKLGSSPTAERSTAKGKKTLPKSKRLLPCAILLPPTTKRIRMKQTDSDSSCTEQMDTSEVT